MDIVITINENDLMKNPNIIDMVKGFAHSLREDPKAEEIGLTHTPVEPETAGQAMAAGLEKGFAEAEQEAPVEDQAPWEEPTAEQPAAPMAEEGAEITISIEEVRAAIAKVSKKHGAATAKKILQNYGAENLSGLDEKFYAAALEEAKAVL